MNRRIVCCLAFIGVLSCSLGFAQEFRMPELFVGDPAPAIQVEEWVKGDPPAKKLGQIFVLDFWASWCGPCFSVMPHMTKIQEKYKDQDLVVIGISVFDKDPETVKAFVKKHEARMGYTVALDLVKPLPEGMAADSPEAQKWRQTRSYMGGVWLARAACYGLPTAFIVNREGRIAWIGHPMQGMEEALEEIVDGTYDLAKQAPAFRQERITEAMKIHLLGLLKKKDLTEANRFFMRHFIDHLSESAEVCNMFAWASVDPDRRAANRDFNLALKAAHRANDLTDEKDPQMVDTLARVYFMKRLLQKAIELQEQAIALAPPDEKQEYRSTLEEYKAAVRKNQ